MLIFAGGISTACFGKLSIAVSNDVQPALFVPGGSVAQEIKIEADGAFGGLIRQSLSQANPASSTSAGWDTRDNSDGSTLRLRMTRTLPIGSVDLANGSGSGPQGGSVDVRWDDYVLARHFVALVSVPPLSPSTPAPSNSTAGAAVGQQFAQLALAGVTFDEALTMPGSITATNGIPGDGSRVVWHLKLDSTGTQTLRAESIYFDLPRIGAALGVVLVAGVIRILRGRRRDRVGEPS